MRRGNRNRLIRLALTNIYACIIYYCTAPSHTHSARTYIYIYIYISGRFKDPTGIPAGKTYLRGGVLGVQFDRKLPSTNARIPVAKSAPG
jgi:hypothetical protein